MNYVFYGLIALAVGWSAWQGVPEADGTVAEGVLTVAAPPGLAKDGSLEIGAEGRVYRFAAPAPADGSVTLPVAELPIKNGAVTVSFPSAAPVALMSRAALDSAKASVDLALSLVGAMTLFLGLMKVVEAGGGLELVARALRPLMVRLFPDVPPDHPAMGAMIMNIAANVLGLGNAATPFGIRAMQELEKLNRHPGTATNAMVLFLAINTSGVAVLPTGVMAMRASLKSAHPEDVFIPTLVASALNTVVAVFAARTFARLMPPPEPPERHPVQDRLADYLPLSGGLLAMLGLVSAVWIYGERAGSWIIPGLIFGMLSFGVARGVKVYETFVEGARDGFNASTRIIPYMVAILVAVGMFRASGAMDILVRLLAPPASLLGIPPEVIPLALLRPLSGSGAYALTAELTKTYGPDSLVGVIAGTMQGTTETTFYVLSVYFGAVGIQRSRHAVLTGICSDASGVLAAVWIVLLMRQLF